MPGTVLSSTQTADGTRAIVMTSSSDGLGSPTTYFVSVINTTTGTQVGNTFSTTLPPPGMSDFGATPTVQLVGNGQHAFVTTPQGSSTMLTLIDTGNGSAVSTNIVAGKTLPTIRSVGDGRVAMVTTSTRSGWMPDSQVTSYVSFIDTATGEPVGSTTALAGNIQPVQFSTDGSRAVITSTQYASGPMFGGPYTGTVAVFDTATGQQVGSGFQGTNLNVVVAGSDAVVTTYSATGRTSPVTGWGQQTAIYDPQVTFLNLATGNQSGETIEYPSGSATSTSTIRLSSNGQWATVTTVSRYATQNPTPTSPMNLDIWHSVTTFETFNTSTGAQVGDTLTSTGAAATSTLLSSNGWYALVTTQSDTDQSLTTTFIDTHSGHTINAYDGMVASGDGNHAIILSVVEGSSRATILDLTTGERLSNGLIPGTSGYAQLSSDGTRALITTSNSGTAHATLFDLTTGQQLSTTDYPGGASIQVTRDLTRAIVLTPSADNSANHATVVNLVNGQQLTDISLAGNQYPQILRTPNDTRAIFTDTTHTVVVDLTTGQQLGSIDARGSIQLNGDGTRAIVTATDYDPETSQVSAGKVVVIDAVTGKQLNAYAEAESGIASAQFAPHGDRAVVVSGSTDNGTGVSTTKVTVLNSATGQKISSISIDQATAQFIGVTFTTDGSHALITTQTHDAATNVTATQLSVIDTTKQDSGTIDNSPGNLLTAVFNQLGAQVTYVVNQVRARIATFVMQVVNTVTGTNHGGSSAPGPFGPANSPEEDAWEAFTISTGWVNPIYGAFLNGVSLGNDFNDWNRAVGNGNTDDAWDETGDMAGDIVGFIPIAGPIAKGLIKAASPTIKSIVKAITKPIADFLGDAGRVADGFISNAVGSVVTNTRQIVNTTANIVNGIATAAQNTVVAVFNAATDTYNWIARGFR